MATYNVPVDLVAYIQELERRLARLEQTATGIPTTKTDPTTSGNNTPTAGRLIFYQAPTPAASKLYGANGTSWNALW